MNATVKAPRCEGSRKLRSVDDGDEWWEAETATCLRCGHKVKWLGRQTDLPPWGVLLAHRTDGTPTR